MRVALDTTFLQRPPSGIGAYVHALRQQLPGIDPRLEIMPFSQPQTGFWARLEPRASRFAWEFAGAGLAARRLHADLLHMPMMARPVLAGCPVVVTVHDVIPFVMPEYRSSGAMRVNLAVARQSIRFAAAVIAPSHHAAGDISRVLDVPGDRIHVTHEAADERFRPALDQELDDRSVLDKYAITRPYVFNVGGLDARKNLSTLIRAFAEIAREHFPELSLVISGAEHSDNPRVFPPIRPLIAELGLTDRVVLTGRVSDEEKLSLMQRASLYVSPSLYEGFGLSVLEAMACGVPVVAANRTSLPEVVGSAGLLVEPRVPDVAEAIVSVLGNPELARRLAGDAVKRSGEFSWQKTAQETIAVYRHVLGMEE